MSPSNSLDSALPSAPQFVHRIARLEDLTDIVAIYNSTVASRMVTADTEEISVESRLNWFHEHTPEKRPLWVVENEQAQIVGWLSFSNFYGRPAYSGTAELSIYLHESMRRKGLGRYFLEQAIAFAPQIKVHTLLGFIFGHNVPSMNLFASFNFEIWANMPKVANLDGIERDLIIFGKRVDGV
jgi:L-amino acid N-acyltransferase YncA